MSVIIQTRRDTAANWTSTNPVLAVGEAGFESDTIKVKYGDGTTTWNSLAYVGASALTATDIGSTVQGYDASTTIQGNTFNGASQLVQMDGSAKLPAVDGSALTNLPESGIGEFINTSNIAISDDDTAINVSTTGADNVGISTGAGASLTTGLNNVLIGNDAGTAVTTSSRHVGIGQNALLALSGGAGGNVAVGSRAGAGLTTGADNIHIGSTAGEYTNSANTVKLETFSDTICIGHYSYATQSGEISLGNSWYTTAAFTAAAFSTRSDRRDKTNIIDTEMGLDFINQLRPVSYNWKQENRSEKVNQGFIAQEVQEVLKNYAGSHAMHSIRGDDPDDEQNLMYTEIIAPLVKAVQELTKRVSLLESK